MGRKIIAAIIAVVLAGWPGGWAAEVSTWDTTAANNNSAAPDGFPENMAPSGVNDAAREVMAAIARRVTDEAFTLRSTGDSTNNLYRVTPSQTISAYSTGQILAFIADFANSSTVGVSVSSLATKEVVKQHDVSLDQNDIEPGQFVMIAYDASGDVFQMLTSPARSTRFTSAEQTITADGSLTLAHSLGVTPDQLAAYLVNQTTQHGYSPGAPVWVNIGAGSNNRGVSVTADTVNLYVRYGQDANTFEVFDATGGTAIITNANWTLVIKAFN